MSEFKEMPKVAKRQRNISFALALLVMVAVALLLWPFLPSKAPIKRSAALAVGQVQVSESDLKKYDSWSDREVLQHVCPTLAKKVEDRDMKNPNLAKAAWVTCAGHFHSGINPPSTRTEILRLALAQGILKG